MQEGALLAQAVTADPSMALECLSQFCALRRQRQDSPEWEQECLVETAEGMAEFADLSALEALAPEKYRAQLDRSRAILQNPGPLLADTRRMAYYSGALFLDRQFSQLPPVPLEQAALEAAAAVAAAQESAHRETLDRFFAASPSCQRGRFRICGYDPMNQFILDRKLYCSHFLALSDLETGEVIHLAGKSLFCLLPDSASEGDAVYRLEP